MKKAFMTSPYSPPKVLLLPFVEKHPINELFSTNFDIVHTIMSIMKALHITSIVLLSLAMFSSVTAAGQVGHKEEGVASFYHDRFEGRKTASGEIFRQDSMTAAHKHIKLGSYVRVTNISNGNSVILKVNDRMPAWNKRSIDLSYRAATELDYVSKGLTRVTIEVIDPATLIEKEEEVQSPPALTQIDLDDLFKGLTVPRKGVFLRYPTVQYYTYNLPTEGRRR
jgi:rare lipoprotein A